MAKRLRSEVRKTIPHLPPFEFVKPKERLRQTFEQIFFIIYPSFIQLPLFNIVRKLPALVKPNIYVHKATALSAIRTFVWFRFLIACNLYLPTIVLQLLTSFYNLVLYLP